MLLIGSCLSQPFIVYVKAVGKRMKVEYEKENRKRKEAQLRALIQEKLNELDR